MRIAKIRVLIIAMAAMIALMGLAFPPVVGADVACRYFGPVQFNGENVPDGTVIKAWLDDDPSIFWTTGTYIWTGSGLSVYCLDVPPAMLGDGGHEGDMVHFSVTLPGGVPLPAPSSTWTQSGGAFVWHPLYLTGPTPPVAEFSADPTECCAPLEVHFTDESTGMPTSWDWNFGDGSAHSFVQNPIHVYTEPSGGNSVIAYTVSLTVGNSEGSDIETKTNYITVHPPLKADFTATPTSGPPPLQVNFTDLSTGTIASRQWNFGDGSPPSSVPNPSHTYAKGTYNVTLTITGHGGSNTTIKQNYIVGGGGAILEGGVSLQGRPVPPDASWITDLTVTFLQGGAVMGTETVTTDNEGKFTIPDVAAGTYDICVKSPRALSELETSVGMVAGTTTPVDFGILREGDANNDDAISLADYALLYTAYGSTPVNPNWNDNCDFNRNGAVDLGDYALLYSNYGQTGDCAP